MVQWLTAEKTGFSAFFCLSEVLSVSPVSAWVFPPGAPVCPEYERKYAACSGADLITDSICLESPHTVFFSTFPPICLFPLIVILRTTVNFSCHQAMKQQLLRVTTLSSETSTAARPSVCVCFLSGCSGFFPHSLIS